MRRDRDAGQLLDHKQAERTVWDLLYNIPFAPCTSVEIERRRSRRNTCVLRMQLQSNAYEKRVFRPRV